MDADSHFSNQSYADKYSHGAFYYNATEQFNDFTDYLTIYGDGFGINLWEPLTFDASRSNPIYGKSVTVQPSAYVVYYIIRLK